PGLLAQREGRLLLAGLEAVLTAGPAVDVALIDATGRDHPRRCGLAVHLGWALDVPTVGVTHRLLTDRHRRPPPGLTRRGDHAVIEQRGRPVAAWTCTRDRTRPLVVHAAWRTDVPTAVAVAVRLASP